MTLLSLFLRRVCPALLVGMLFLLSARAESQEYRARWALRLGYYMGNGIPVNSGSESLRGLEVGGEIPLIARIPRIGGLSLSPSIAFGGSTTGGSDLDGNIYRVLLTLKRELGTNGLYGGIGLGFSAVDARIGAFPNTSGFAQHYLVGFRFSQIPNTRYEPYFELGYHEGNRNSLRGWAFNLGIRF